AEPSAPGAPLSGSSRRPPQRAGSRLAFVLASSFAPNDAQSSPGGSAPPPTPGLRRAPRAARRFCRVSGGGDARSHVFRPRSGGRPGVLASRGGSPPSSAARARRVPERPGSGRLPAARSPGVAREPRAGPPAWPPLAVPGGLAQPPSRRHLPRARRAPCPSLPRRRALGGATGAGLSPPAAPAPLPRDAWATCARISLQGAGLGASCTSWTRGRGEGRGRKRLQTLSSWTFPGKVRESGAGAAGRRTNPEAAAEPELLSFCDAEGHESSERRRGGRRRPSDIRQAGLFRNAPGRLNGGVSCLDFPNRKGKT
ncbi:unnamed protein product, partial [Rangifer tarandus platyrhynchus]